MSGCPTHAKPEVVFFSGAIPVRFFFRGREGGGGGWVFTQPANEPANNWTCFGHYPDMFWPSSGHVLGIIWPCFGHHLGMFSASSRHVLVIIRTCFGYHPDMFWVSSGHVLGIIQTCFGHVLAMFRQALDKVLNQKIIKNQKSSKKLKFQKNSLSRNTPGKNQPRRSQI